MPVRKSQPFAFFAEDDDDEIERKIFDTSVLYGHRRADYADFAYMGRFADDNLLFVRSKGGIATTALYADLCQMVADEHRDLLLFDGIPDIYALSLNDQGEVTWALGKMLAMAKPTRATVMLLGHPNKAGTSEFTGCGAWENKPRARLYLGPAKQKAGDEDDEVALNDPRRQLRRSKANLSAKDALDVIWEEGTFRLENPGFATYGDKLDRDMRKGHAKQVFLDALAKLTEQRHLGLGRNPGRQFCTDGDQGLQPRRRLHRQGTRCRHARAAQRRAHHGQHGPALARSVAPYRHRHRTLRAGRVSAVRPGELRGAGSLSLRDIGTRAAPPLQLACRYLRAKREPSRTVAQNRRAPPLAGFL